MPIGCLLLLLFTLVPLVELALLLQVSQWVGVGWTIVLVLLTGVVGATLARVQGFAVLARLRGRLAAGELPGRELADGAILLVSGALLVTPGVLTDVIGFCGLLPPTRALIRAWLLNRFRRGLEDGSLHVSTFGFGAPGGFGGFGFPGGPADGGGPAGPAGPGDAHSGDAPSGDAPPVGGGDPEDTDRVDRF